MSVNRDEILTAAANGNASALEFLRVFARRAHWVDDVVDGDGKGDIRDPLRGRPFADSMAAYECEWLLTLSGNPFFLAHRAQLVPAMVLALNAWVDSNRSQGTGDRDQVVRDVVKGQWHEVVWLVAWLTGGWTTMREVSGKYRDYDFEGKEQKGTEGVKAGPNNEDLKQCKWCGDMFIEGPNHRVTGIAGYCNALCAQQPLIGRKEANGMPG